MKYPLFLLLITSLGACNTQFSSDTLFKTIDPQDSNISFQNTVENNDTMNIFNYRNFYNGAGVAIGDVNNDGLADVYLVANQGLNRLYLNKGNFQFEDITQQAGVGGTKKYSTGAVMADVNADGYLDIYVCNSGEGDDRANELFINQRNGTFVEKAAEYGLDDRGYSTHAAFFDYDRDGDLDMFLLENSSYPVNKLGYKNIRDQRDPLAGQKLFKNTSQVPGDTPHFDDVSEQAGIYGSLIGFGLGITIGDVNDDLYPDIYISNDFYERDYLYINQQDGTFAEQSKEQMGHISMSSMGADVADINNDGKLDIFSTDMLPWDDYRLKTTMVYEDINLTTLKLDNDFYHQYSRNMLQLNNGDNTFSEVGALAGVHATDWSWGALIFDMDNDGQKDLFVANGIYKNVTDQDFVQFLNDEGTMQPYLQGKKFNYRDFVEKMAVAPIANYAFKNNGNLSFANKAQEWGLNAPSFSSGAAYGDLDNDGDLDLIVNNTNQPVGVFKNQSVEKFKTNFIRVKLQGSSLNTHGIGARVKVYQKGRSQVLEQMPNRGFESSVDYTMVVGLGKESTIDSIVVVWPDAKKQVISRPTINTTLLVNYKRANQLAIPKPMLDTRRFADLTTQANLIFEHRENYFIDFDRDALLKQMYSRLGPALAVGDVNADALDDVFFGAASGELKKLFVQLPNGQFKEQSAASLNTDKAAEVVAAHFFDADGDRDLDLLMVTGGNDNYPSDPTLTDYLYLNDGKGNFSKDMRFPQVFESGASVAVADVDLDGDLDAFVCGRLIPGQYGLSPKHHLYRNEGKGRFRVEEQVLAGVGMVTDAVWIDLNKDRFPELLVCQDWGSVVVCSNDKGRELKPQPLANTQGWWNRIRAVDLDSDGDTDFVVGNGGLNNRLVADPSNPATLWVNDFDRNGRLDQIITCVSEDGQTYPMILKNDLQKQIPSIKKKYTYFKDFGKKKMEEVFDAKELEGVLKREVVERRTGILVNNDGQLSFVALPLEAQFSPVHGIEVFDYDGDKRPDLMLTGNFFDNQTELGRYDANYGQIWRNQGKNQFVLVPPQESGFRVQGQVRNVARLRAKDEKSLFVLAKNSDKAQVFGLKAKQ